MTSQRKKFADSNDKSVQMMDAKVKLSPMTSEMTKRGVFSFIQEFKEELKKVTWTSKSELILCTKIVLATTFVFGLGIYLTDLAISGVLNAFRYAVHFIFG
jgi:preprotein translocase subunit SecE